MSQTNELINTIGTSGVEQQTSDFLKEKFMNFFLTANEWKDKVQAIVVTDESQITEMKQAREARLALRAVRIEADKTRKALKEDSLRYGKAVQSVYNLIEGVISPLEEHCEKQEKFIEIQQEKSKDELRRKREWQIAGYEHHVPYGSDLGTMNDIEFDNLLKFIEFNIQKEKEQAQAAENKAREEAEERERIKAENEALRQQAIAQQQELDRKKAEAEKLERELLEKQRAEEAKAKAEAEAKRQAELKSIAEQKEKEEAERKAANAPIKEQMNVWVDSFSIGNPICENATTLEIQEKFEGFKNWAKSKISNL